MSKYTDDLLEQIIEALAVVIAQVEAGVGSGSPGFDNSSELAALIDDETGTGALVFANTPTLVTPVIGAATGTSLTTTGTVAAYSATAVPAGGTTGSGIKVSSTANLGIFFGSDVPTLSAAQGSLYIRTDGSSTSTRLYVNSNGTTGWVAVTTAS